MERIARLHSREILRLLISHGSDVMSKDNTGATVLYRSVVNMVSYMCFLRLGWGGGRIHMLHYFHISLYIFSFFISAVQVWS